MDIPMDLIYMHVLYLFNKRKDRSIPISFISFFEKECRGMSKNVIERIFLTNGMKNNIKNINELIDEYAKIYENKFNRIGVLIVQSITYNRCDILKILCKYRDPFIKNYNCLRLCLNDKKNECRKYLLTKVPKRRHNDKEIADLLDGFSWYYEEGKVTIFNELHEVFNFTENELAPIMINSFMSIDESIDYPFIINLINKGAPKFIINFNFGYEEYYINVKKLDIIKYIFKDVTNKNVKEVMTRQEYEDLMHGLETTGNKDVIKYFKDKGIEF